MSDMQEPLASADQATIAELRRLRTENGTLRRRMEQRDRTIGDLNRRLLYFERGHATAQTEFSTASWAGSGPGQPDLAAITADRDRLAAEVERLYSTKLFRLFAPARQAYGRLRGTL